MAKFAIVEEAMRKGLVIDCDVLLGKEAYIFEVCRVPEILIVSLILTATLRRVSQSRKITDLHRTNALHSSIKFSTRRRHSLICSPMCDPTLRCHTLLVSRIIELALLSDRYLL